MADYNNILLATDLSSDWDELCNKATKLAKTFDAKLSFLHIVEHIPVELASDMMMPPMVDLDTPHIENARAELDSKIDALQLPYKAERWVELGNTKNEIFRTVEESNIDLLILGNHPRHGLGVLFGSTATSVLHKAPCDVLTVRLTDA